ncbi:hypothetical protein [Actinomycetospora sp.]|uniref:hypothetical protein n=1 Tax=Actinomycetospora sp. TaxID=1872135 RepID=UPI002F42D412
MDPSPPAWPARRPSHGDVTLRAYDSRDVAMVRDLATDPYVPLVGTLPAHADEAQALDYIDDRGPPSGYGRLRTAARGLTSHDATARRADRVPNATTLLR